VRRKTVVKLVFVYVPIAVWLALVSSCTVDKWRTEQLFKPFTDTVLGADHQALHIHLTEKNEGETVFYNIQLLGSDGEVRNEWPFTVDKDMFGGGFVATADLDDDGQQEVLAWGAHEEKNSFFIDARSGQIFTGSFSQLPQQWQDRVQQWHRSQILRPMEIIVFTGIFLICFLIVGCILLLLRLFRRKHSKAPG
jgi:hypothetical protein